MTETDYGGDLQILRLLPEVQFNVCRQLILMNGQPYTQKRYDSFIHYRYILVNDTYFLALHFEANEYI